ncbi:unnamed protein product [Rangifer tarandus platyrhynchus]|uniref:Uncharacterized protein n=1 Tax=Rangifer tarandus platyrhynchus TaxID=3082113 RepID=A0AC59Y1D8_RANTA
MASYILSFLISLRKNRILLTVLSHPALVSLFCSLLRKVPQKNDLYFLFLTLLSPFFLEHWSVRLSPPLLAKLTKILLRSSLPGPLVRLHGQFTDLLILPVSTI